MDNQKKLLQGNAITQARYKMSSIEKDVLYMLMYQMNDSDKPDHKYHISLTDMRHETGNPHLEVEDIRKVIRKLQVKIISLPDQTKKFDFMDVQLLGSAKYLLGSGLVELQIHSKIRPHFVDLKKRYTMYRFTSAINIRNPNGKRLYEMASHWKTLEALHPISVDELKKRLGISEAYNFSTFENRVLKKGISQINEFSELTMSYHKMKTGRSYTHIQFVVKEKTNQQTKIKFEDENKQLVGRLVNEFKVQTKLANQIVMCLPSKEIRLKLRDIQLNKIEVKDIGAYTFSCFKKYI